MYIVKADVYSNMQRIITGLCISLYFYEEFSIFQPIVIAQLVDTEEHLVDVSIGSCLLKCITTITIKTLLVRKCQCCFTALKFPDKSITIIERGCY